MPDITPFYIKTPSKLIMEKQRSYSYLINVLMKT